MLFSVIYNEKSIRITDIYNEYGNKELELISNLRSASRHGELFCEECGDVAVFAFGKKNTPHFKHKAVNNCPLHSLKYDHSEEYLKAIKVIDAWLENQYQNLNMKMFEILGKYRPAFQLNSGLKFTIDYIRTSKDIKKYIERIRYFERQGYIPIAFLSEQNFLNSVIGEIISWELQNCSINDIIAYLNPLTKKVTFQKLIEVEYYGKVVKQTKVNNEIKLCDVRLDSLSSIFNNLFFEAESLHDTLLKEYKKELEQREKDQLLAKKKPPLPPIVKEKEITYQYKKVNNELIETPYYKYNVKRYRTLLLDEFCKECLHPYDVYELLSYIKQNPKVLLKKFPKLSEVELILSHNLAKYSEPEYRTRYISLETVIERIYALRY